MSYTADSYDAAAGREPERRFQTFEDLAVYQTARSFRKAMYCVAGHLPDFGKFGLASQIRRAAVSLTNNLAEGHGRFHHPDQIRFVLQARGSLEELIDDLNVCEDEGYLPSADVSELKRRGWDVLKLANGYLRWLRDRRSDQSKDLREEPAAYAADEIDSPEKTAALSMETM